MKEFKWVRKRFANVKSEEKILKEKALSEASILSRLQHENIIKHVDVFLNQGLFYLVMEFAEEGDLALHIQKQKMLVRSKEGDAWTKAFIIRLFSQIVSGLNYLHRNKIMHRDLKPQNILVSQGFILKIADFGLAKQLQEDQMFARYNFKMKISLQNQIWYEWRSSIFYFIIFYV